MRRAALGVVLAAGAMAFGACAPQDGPMGQPTPAQLQTPVPPVESHPADPVIPMPPEEPGTIPPAPLPAPSPTTPP